MLAKDNGKVGSATEICHLTRLVLENRESVGKSLKEVEKRFPDGIPLLDPVEDMKIKEGEFEETVRKIEVLEQR